MGVKGNTAAGGECSSWSSVHFSVKSLIRLAEESTKEVPEGNHVGV